MRAPRTWPAPGTRTRTRPSGRAVPAILAVPLVLTLLLAGCFSDRPAPMEPEGTVPDVECSVVIPEPGPGEAVVAIRDFAFHPAELSVPEGTEVTWINCEEATLHTATADDDAWDSGGLSPGETFERTFGEAGTFGYHCTPHPFMTAEVVVEP